MSLLDYTFPNTRPDSRLSLTERQLLQSVVEIARHVFRAAASSIFLVDAQTRDLIFEAVAGEGAAQLPGTRFPSGTGIVGWVSRSGQPLFIDDLASSDLFARAAAESTGYVPSSLMAAPLIRRDDCIGVLEVLDPRDRTRGGLTDLDLLALLGAQAAISLDLLVRARRPRSGEGVAGEQTELLGRIDDRIRTADPAIVSVVTKMLAAADDLLAGASGDATQG